MDSKNLYGLPLPSLTVDDKSHPKNDDEEELLNILPSYQMYQSTVSRMLTPTVDDSRTPAPDYELTPQSSNASAAPLDYFAVTSLPSSPALELDSFHFSDPADPADPAEEARNNERLLENVHKLKRLTAVNPDVSKKLSIQIFLTEKLGKPGVKPTIVDPLDLELKQSDCIYGFIVVKNKTDIEIPFDMFSVVLEGNETFGATKLTSINPPTRMQRFLTMFDFNASWNDANLDRLTTDHHDPRVPTLIKDPVDGCYVNLHSKKIFEPGASYKKYFAFRLPERLLESACEHGLIKHLQLPPTVGVCKNEMVSSLRKKWKTGGAHAATPNLDQHSSGKAEPASKHYVSLCNDFAFPDSSVDYSVSARIVGKASNYESILSRHAVPLGAPSGDEFVVVNEDFCFLRFISHANDMFELNRLLITEEAKLMYVNMVDKIKFALASRQTELMPSPLQDSDASGFVPLEPSQSSTELAKMQQKYSSRSRKHRDHMYEVLSPYKKKAVFGASKVLGLIAFSTPNKEYRVDYISPAHFGLAKRRRQPKTNIKIPINLTFIFSDKSSSTLPDFKHISVELVVLSVKSKGLPIPVVIHPEMLFDYRHKGHDTFDVTTIKTFQRYAVDLSKLLKDYSAQQLGLDRQIIQDIKCLANLTCKHDHLKFRNPIIEQADSNRPVEDLSAIKWELIKVPSSSSKRLEEQTKFTKSFVVNVDMRNAMLNASHSQDFCLIPCFQSCLLARLYYIKINLKCPNGEKVLLRVPLVLQRED